MKTIDELKSKITYENKTTIGIIGIIIGFLTFLLGVNTVGIIAIGIMILPAILLIIPDETIKNSKIIGIILIILVSLMLIGGLFSTWITINEYLPMSFAFAPGYVEMMLIGDICGLVLGFYALFCAFSLTIPTKPQQLKNLYSTQNGIKYSKYCSKCGQGLLEDTKFCPKCGTQLDEFEK